MKTSHTISILLFLFATTCYAGDSTQAAGITDTKILEILLKNTDVLLKNGKYCTNASAQSGAKTFGDYLAGHWLVQKSTTAKNWLEIIINKDKNRAGWAVDVMIYQEFMAEEGGGTWLQRRGVGVQLFIKPDLTADRNSFMCIGTD
ncbi:MAG: hypothetical protein OEZ39_01700 [Gammaproteobacteria bacterium]|nr:hypothetical protein [Gammaproteobacteria bacterium]MDH5650567.1 hypothetical protein [Gammaproteobacteria bacterium]